MERKCAGLLRVIHTLKMSEKKYVRFVSKCFGIMCMPIWEMGQKKGLDYGSWELELLSLISPPTFLNLMNSLCVEETKEIESIIGYGIMN
jgi:hypothetical protein